MTNLNKQSSVLDYPHPGLDPEIWSPEGKLLPQHKKAILDTMDSLLTESGFKHYKEWIKQVKLIGSLTTYQYISTTDVDVHMVVDLDKFVELEEPDLKEAVAEKFLDETRKIWELHLPTLPRTKHPLELYFELPDVTVTPNPQGTGVYDIRKDEWIKPPVSIKDDFDIEEMKPYLRDLATELMEDLDISFGEIKRQVDRIEELQEVMKAWDGEHQQQFKKKIDSRLAILDEEVMKLIEVREEIIKQRKDYSQESAQELKFKYLQKFGYMMILSQLKDLFNTQGEVTEKDIPKLKEIMTTAAKAQRLDPYGRLCIDFDHTVTGHEKFEDGRVGKPQPGVKEAFDKLKAEGWEIIIYSGRANNEKGLNEIKAFMDEYDLPYDEMYVGKPIAEWYIDDRNLVFSTWDAAVKQVGQPGDTCKKQAQFNAEYDFSSTQVDLPKDLAQKVVEWGVKNIPNEELYDDESKRYGRELESHVTVLYGIDTNDGEAVEKFLSAEKPVHVKFGKTTHFTDEKNHLYDVVIVQCESDDLTALNKKLADKFGNEGARRDYKPHVTIAYVKEGTGEKYDGETILDGEVTIDSVIFSPLEGDKKQIELTAALTKFEPNQIYTLKSDLVVYPSEVGEEKETLKKGTEVRYLGNHGRYFAAIGEVDGKTYYRVRPQALRDAFPTSEKEAEFMPGIATSPPNNPRQQDSDVEIPVDPGPVSDETTNYRPIEDKPRVGFWDKILQFLKIQPKAKVEPPHARTTWDDPEQDGEPYKTLPVTYSPKTNDDNLGQPGVRRFMGRPEGEEYSDEDDVMKMLLQKKPLSSRDTHVSVTKVSNNTNSVVNPKITVKNAEVYTSKEMEDIQDPMREFDDSEGGGNVFHDWNQDTSNFPKVPERPKVRLDIMQRPVDRAYPPQDTPPYEVTWYDALPAEDDTNA